MLSNLSGSVSSLCHHVFKSPIREMKIKAALSVAQMSHATGKRSTAARSTLRMTRAIPALNADGHGDNKKRVVSCV